MNPHSIKRAAAFLALVLCAEAPQAMSGNVMAQLCLTQPENPDNFSSEMACTYFVMGAVSGFYRARETAFEAFIGAFNGVDFPVVSYKKFRRPVCGFDPPEGVSGAQMADIFRLYLKNHPERRHEDAATLVLDSLAEAFPCKP